MRTTLKEPLKIEGINVFTGRRNSATIHPSARGLEFYSNREIIPVSLERAFVCRPWRTLRMARCIAIQGDKSQVKKTEHFLATLYCLGIDDALIELSDGICPRFDFGVSPLVEALKDSRADAPGKRTCLELRSGLEPRERSVSSNSENLVLDYSNTTAIDYEVSWPHASVGNQYFLFELSEHNFAEQIMKARAVLFLPFGSRFLLNYTPLPKFFGVNERNTLLIGSKKDEQFANLESPQGVYGRTEFVRHCILDVLGTLALSQCYFSKVRFSYFQGGHDFELSSLKELFRRQIFREA